MDREALDRLITRADVDGLVGLVDQLGTAGDWEGLATTAEACRYAVTTGRQLWPVTALAEYRLALVAPAPWAARVLVEHGGLFSIGPLSEVAASTHAWDELAPHVTPGPLRSFVAHERVLRGEDLRGADVDAQVLDLPLVVAPWEPAYPLAEYQTTEATFPAPARPALHPVTLRKGGLPAEDPEAVDALRDLVGVWLRDSNGRADIAAVEGDHLAAVAALGVPDARVAEVDPGTAMAWMAWAAASGGAHGRRPGLAHGRFAAWWAVASLLGMRDDWPLDPEDLGSAAGELRWFLWDAYEPVTGWQLQVAVWDPADGLAWAISASDQA